MEGGSWLIWSQGIKARDAREAARKAQDEGGNGKKNKKGQGALIW